MPIKTKFPKTAKGRTTRGMTLIETVLYVAIFSSVSIAVLGAITSTMRVFDELRAIRDNSDSAVSIMERMTRDIKSAESVDVANSTFDIHPGRLTLNTQNASGTAMVVEYYVSNGILRLRENGVDQGSLMTARGQVDALVFRLISGTKTTAVKTELHLNAKAGKSGEVEHYYNTSILRGSY